MTLPAKLKTGTVLIYSFLWSREQVHGEDSGRKDRPVAVAFNLGHKIALVPITSQAPHADEPALEIPEIEKQRAGLDVAKRLWLIPTEMNIDDPANSYYLEPKSVIGEFLAVFTEKLKTEIKSSLRLLRRDHKVFHVDSTSDAQRQEMIYLVSKSEFAKSATSKQAMAFGAAILDAYAPKAIASQAQQGIINRRSELKAG